MWSLLHEDRKLGCAARLREGELDGIQVGYVLVANSYETLDLFLNKFQLLTALVCSVIVSVECNEMHFKRECCGNIVANRFSLIDSAKVI